MTRRIGPERASLADALTLSRATCGAVLAGLVSAGVRDRAGPAGRLGWLATLTGATVTDWLDGPLARQAGPTQIGKALDIEADSWLTLWSAAGAVAWGGLPRWCLLPPLLRYTQPLLAFRSGGVPTGGGPWWSRATGVAQMALIVAALSPFHSRLRAAPAAGCATDRRGAGSHSGGAELPGGEKTRAVTTHQLSEQYLPSTTRVTFTALRWPADAK